jgi:hypothetical protein
MSGDKVITWQSKDRMKKAIEEGRQIGVSGHPFYLEDEELEIYKEELRQQTRIGNYLTLREGALLVFFAFRSYYILRHGV